MRSPVRRLALERGLRAAAFGLLAACAWALISDAPAQRRTDAPQSALRGEFVRWTRGAAGESLHVTLRTAPGPLQRDWLRALSVAGTGVTWSGPLPATAIEVLPAPDPAGGIRVLAAAPAGLVRLADSLGTIDSAVVRSHGASFALAAQGRSLWLTAQGQGASARPADSLVPRHAVVLGHAEWEARFVISALEERGWTVDARLAVAPGLQVTQGRAMPLDTARQAVVVALDSLAPADAQAIGRFVASGGGAVLGAAAARTVPSLAAGGVGEHVRPPVLSFSAAQPRRALAMDPVLPRRDAVVLERQEGHVVVAARRSGPGRVVQIGYDETWRWRMANMAEAVEQHREWWAGIVAAAAYRAETPDGGRQAAADPAPLASLVAALGPAAPEVAARGAAFDLRSLLPVAATLLFLVLLAEWASRRLRGAA